MSIDKYIEKQRRRYEQFKLNNNYFIPDLFDKINELKNHFNDWRPSNEEFDDFIKNHIIPSLKYLGQDKNREYNKLKKNKKNLTNNEIRRYNYLIQLRKYKILNYLDCVELEKDISKNKI